MVNQILVRQYGMAIYLNGTRKFSDITEPYHSPVKQWAALNLTLHQIDNALVNGYITEQEYQDTLDLRNV